VTFAPPFGQLTIISESELSDQSKLAWGSVLPKALLDAHDKRKREWIASRCALQLAFIQVGIVLEPIKLTWNGMQQIAGLEDWRFSISHSKEWSLIWLVKSSEAATIGADLELKDRKISLAVKKRISLKQDIAMEAIHLWSAKEASYKALPPDLQKELWLGQIFIGKKKFSIESKKDIGRWVQGEQDTKVVTVAWTDF
jgi:4'-phosphopantetheinyl transferase EntD